MELPDDSIGVSDLIGYRECPRRMSYQMRRHVARGQQSEATQPEAQERGAVYGRSYGSAIHEAIELVEDGYSDEDAVQKAWNKYGVYLDPPDVNLLLEDLKTYHERDFPRTRVVASEDDFRIPLFVHPEFGQVYFRFKLDRLYERLDAPGTFISVDYKSSKWAKTEKEVFEDIQQWAYAWAAREFFPEIERLIQVYDQLRHGQVTIPQKTTEELAEIKQFLIAQATAVLEDEDRQADGLLAPKKNEWCAYCSIMESCPVIDNLLDFALVEIDALAPTEKQGRRLVMNLDPDRKREYLDKFNDVREALKILERFKDAVAEIIQRMPELERAEFGFELKSRKASKFTVTAKQMIHERLGEDFYEVVSISKAAIERYAGDDKDLIEWALSLVEESVGAETIKARN